MSDRANQLKQTLAALAADDRAELAKYLLETLDPPGEKLGSDEWNATWTEELNRRSADVESGKAKLIPMADFVKEMREKYP